MFPILHKVSVDTLFSTLGIIAGACCLRKQWLAASIIIFVVLVAALIEAACVATREIYKEKKHGLR